MVGKRWAAVGSQERQPGVGLREKHRGGENLPEIGWTGRTEASDSCEIRSASTL